MGRRFLALLLAAAALSSCARTTARTTGSRPEPRLSAAQEAQIGALADRQLLREARGREDDALLRESRQVGARLAAAFGGPAPAWRVSVLDFGAPNAFALPGGYVYVTRGLLETADRLDELAGVMGHEVGHVVQRHSVKQLEKSERRDVGLLALCTVTNACSTIGRVVALQVGADAMAAKYSRTDEAQADSEAVVITLAAGIDPEGVPAFFRKMLEQQKEAPTPLDAFFASHPTDQARISALSRQIEELGPLSGRTLARDTPEFHVIQARVRSLPPPPRTNTAADP